jgi:hypothetical protein
MPISLRLPSDIEDQIAGFGALHGLSKSAVIVRSIQEFLAHHTHPSSQQIYEEAMRDAQKTAPQVRAPDARPHKQKLQAAMQHKHAERSARASQVETKTKRAGKST